MRTLEVYIDATRGADRILRGVLGALFTIAVPVAWVLYIRWCRRTKRLAAAATSS